MLDRVCLRAQMMDFLQLIRELHFCGGAVAIGHHSEDVQRLRSGGQSTVWPLRFRLCGFYLLFDGVGGAQDGAPVSLIQ